MLRSASTAAAAAFVALWSTGFIVARAIKPYADPNLYLLARFCGTALLYAGIALAARARGPRRANGAVTCSRARCCKASI